MLSKLKEILSQEEATDGLPRNRKDYRIVEINFEKGGSSYRPRDWDYAYVMF